MKKNNEPVEQVKAEPVEQVKAEPVEQVKAEPVTLEQHLQHVLIEVVKAFTQVKDNSIEIASIEKNYNDSIESISKEFKSGEIDMATFMSKIEVIQSNKKATLNSLSGWGKYSNSSKLVDKFYQTYKISMDNDKEIVNRFSHFFTSVINVVLDIENLKEHVNNPMFELYFKHGVQAAYGTYRALKGKNGTNDTFVQKLVAACN